MSVEMEMQCEGLEDFQSKIQRLDSAMKNNVHSRLAELAVSVKEMAMRIVPVRTGYLRSTIFAEVQEWAVRVGAYAHYARFVEFGTRFMRAYRFLSQAMEAHLPQLAQMVSYAVDESVVEASTS